MKAAKLISITHGPMIVEIAPACGSIASFRHQKNAERIDFFRPADTRDIEANEPTGMGCFPLVPFSGAIPGGFFEFEGDRYAFPKNHVTEPLPTHGDGWLRAWEVTAHGPDHAHLYLNHSPSESGPPSGFPFAYSANQTFQIEEDTLTVGISVTNKDVHKFPAGIGIHPYFVKTPDVTLQLANPNVWPQPPYDAESKPAATPKNMVFTEGRALGDLILDQIFAGWRHKAVICWPAWQCSLEIVTNQPLNTVVIYAPEREDYFCVEPVSNIEDAFNAMALGLPGHGAKVLVPGETLSARVSFGQRFHGTGNYAD